MTRHRSFDKFNELGDHVFDCSIARIDHDAAACLAQWTIRASGILTISFANRLGDSVHVATILLNSSLGTDKRGSGMVSLSLDEALVPAESQSADVLSLDQALTKLEAFDARKCRVIEMRYFGGCTVEETAEALNIATITVIRETRVAEAWLRRTMLGEPA